MFMLIQQNVWISPVCVIFMFSWMSKEYKKYMAFIGIDFSIMQKKPQENIKYFYYIWKLLNMTFNVSAVNSIHFLCCFSGCNQRKTNDQYVKYWNLNLSSIHTFCMLLSYVNIIIPTWTFSLLFPIFCIVQC